jgi:outer membrane lipoprotein SlyB
MPAKLTKYAALLPLALMATACAQDLSTGRYAPHAVGQVRQVELGVIDSYRWVEIRGDESGIGTVAGAGIGGAAGSTIGDGATGVIGAIGGALVGGLIGNSVDKSASRQSGFEYVIRTQSGSLVTIVQADKQPLPEGAPVQLIFGRDRTRVILDTRALQQNNARFQNNGSQGGNSQGNTGYQSRQGGQN